MVVFYLRNSRTPNSKIVPVTVSLNREVLVGSSTAVRSDQNPVATGTQFPNLQDFEGEDIWVLTLSTTERDDDGDLIPTEVINLTSADNVHQELEAALGRLGSKVNWGPVLPDDYAPQVVEIFPPVTQTSDVPITSNLIVRLQDPLPASGMDLSTLHLSINGLPIVVSGSPVAGAQVEFRGNVFDLTLIHRPKRIL